jgi:2-C-methyl-D-erythritol 2,4-cyclodiphosphate synthase
LCDALFGACALGDIGTHFPDSDDTYKNADSIQLLCRAAAIADEKRGARLINADATIAVQAPKLAPYIPEMRRRIAAALRADDSQIGIKATTTDALGFVGRGEGAAVFAVVLLEIKNDG